MFRPTPLPKVQPIMLSANKWKWATCGLALTTLLSLYSQFGSENAASETQSQSRTAHTGLASLQRLHLPAGFAGIDEDQLLRDLRSASSSYQVKLICERLGIFGSDRSINPLAAFVRRYPKYAQYALLAVGGIGSESATESLLKFAGNGRARHSGWAIKALATTGTQSARTQLLEWADQGSRTLQLLSIGVLGNLGGEEAMELLFRFSSSTDQRILMAVVDSAAAMGTEQGTELLRLLSESGSRDVRVSALLSFPSDINEDEEEWLLTILTEGDWQTASEAAGALGRAKAKDALPLLLDIAKTAVPPLRLGAIKAIAMMADKEALASLKDIVASAPKTIAYEAGRALLDSGDEGRSTFLAIMHRSDFDRSQLIYLLSELEGEEVDQLRMDIAKNGTSGERSAVLEQLVEVNTDEAVALLIDQARHGSTSSRNSAIYALSQNPSPQVVSVIGELSKKGGRIGQEALRILGNRAGTDPQAEEVLLEALYSGNPTRMQAASWALSNAGTPAAKEALLAALHSEDRNLAKAAMSSFSQRSGNAEMADAFRNIASNSNDKDLQTMAMQQMVNSGMPGAHELVLSAVREGNPETNSILSGLLMSSSRADTNELVAAAMESKSPETRTAVAYGLANRSAPDTVQQLDKLTRDDNTQVKSSAIYALANTGTSAATDRLLEMANDESVGAHRSQAMNALIQAGDPRATPLLIKAFQSDDSEFASNAISGSYNAGPEVDEALLLLAENVETDMHLRRQAATALANRDTSANRQRIETLQQEMKESN